MTSNLNQTNLMSNIKSHMAAVVFAVASITAPSLALADLDDSQIYLEMEAVTEKSGNTALDTVEDVLKAHPGYVIGFEADQKRNQLVYEYEIMQPAENRIVEVTVNAEDGRVLVTSNDEIDYDLPRTEKEMERVVDFVDAWRRTEEIFGQYVVEAELDEDNGHLFYEFGILESYRESKVLIDAHTGTPKT